MLNISKVETFYGNIQALRGVDVKVNDGEIVALIGSNGAGKSTLLMTISGVNKAATGEILFESKSIANLPPHDIVNLGISQVPEGRRIFSELSVSENLRLGGFTNDSASTENMERVFELFPILKTRSKHYGITVSEYKQRNLLKTDVSSKDVAEWVGFLVSSKSTKTTGSQIPIDGGNDRIV